MKAVSFRDVWEMYRINFIIEGKNSLENFWALKGATFEIESGESVGIIGENGAGKSTVLKIIAGMLKADRGAVEACGKVAGLLDLGAGFQSELTGRENVYLICALFGLSPSKTQDVYPDIVDFADIGRFIHAPVKCYSQGMFVRLAFSVAIHVNPDILLIDDTLAVGDEYFQGKCLKKVFELKEKGRTIVFVTHDMGMLKRLCKRAIFLHDGRIVCDGPTEKVIPLYSQLTGSREGLAVLEKKPLQAVFNNGRMFINWQGCLLTPNSGIYTSFFIPHKWYNSLQAQWQVEKEGENTIIATGRFYQLDIVQIWKIELAGGYSLNWDVEVISAKPFDIQEAYVNIMLTNEYRKWFTTLEKGDFPPIDYWDKSWHPLLNANISSRGIGVEENTAAACIPSLVFEKADYPSTTYVQVLNTDYLDNCRVLQYKILGLKNYSCVQSSRIAYFYGKISLDRKDIDSYLSVLRDEFILSGDNWELVSDGRRCTLSYKNKPLTSSNHIYTSIYANGRWYYADWARGEIEKNSDGKIISKVTWPGLPLVQVWEIEKLSGMGLRWKISLRVEKEVRIEEQYVWFMFNSSYKHWFSDYGCGVFPDEFLEVETDMLSRCIPDGAVGIKCPDGTLPAVSLRFAKGDNIFSKIFNSNFHNKSRTLRVERVEPESGVCFPPGEYPCFDIEVQLHEKGPSLGRALNTLSTDKMKFIFDNGRGRIYWQGQEITKKLGMYTSLREKGRWHDSVSSAIWEVFEGPKGIIKVRGSWLHLPIVQNWHMRLIDGGAIEFKASLTVEDKFEVERMQANLMLLESYAYWLAGKEEGRFGLFRGDVDDDWDCIWAGEADGQIIGVRAGQDAPCPFPDAAISVREPFPEWALRIINSDIYHRSRVLQYASSQEKILLPGDYPYFSGYIYIGALPPGFK